MTVWIVKHYWDVDGGFGDAIEKGTVVAAFTSHRAAKRFCNRHWRRHVYAKPLASLWCGYLRAEKLEVATSYDPASDDFVGWWERDKKGL